LKSLLRYEDTREKEEDERARALAKARNL